MRIGLLPAAGRATRLQCAQSKECLPVSKDRYAADALLSAYLKAHLDYAQWITRPEKNDIEAHYGRLYRQSLPLNYQQIQPTKNTVETVYQCIKSGLEHTYYLGFPDIQFKPDNAFTEIDQISHADLTLGLFPSQRPDKVDMVKIDDNGNITDLEMKNPNNLWEYSWILAKWGPRFNQLLCDFVETNTTDAPDDQSTEYYIGHVIKKALKTGLIVKGVTFESGCMLDIGTPEDLNKSNAFWT